MIHKPQPQPPQQLPQPQPRPKPRPLPLSQVPMRPFIPPLTHTSSHPVHPQPHASGHSGHSGQWLSSSSSSLAQTSFSQPRSRRELYPLRHQPQSYPQARPHSLSHTHSYGGHHAPSQYRYPVQETSFAHPPRAASAAGARGDPPFSNPSLSNVEAVTHAIRNKIILEEDEEDILSTDRFY
ncbi:protein TonB-like [Drosophila obscura]|uniref:protein TonB-like n=1 Tax=Drosophila obscura TaxID=7282 RepID=UPI001BB25116|nr:protein TonB-like [Drosophila obscura]